MAFCHGILPIQHSKLRIQDINKTLLKRSVQFNHLDVGNFCSLNLESGKFPSLCALICLSFVAETTMRYNDRGDHQKRSFFACVRSWVSILLHIASIFIAPFVGFCMYMCGFCAYTSTCTPHIGRTIWESVRKWNDFRSFFKSHFILSHRPNRPILVAFTLDNHKPSLWPRTTQRPWDDGKYPTNLQVKTCKYKRVLWWTELGLKTKHFFLPKVQKHVFTWRQSTVLWIKENLLYMFCKCKIIRRPTCKSYFHSCVDVESLPTLHYDNIPK